MDEPSREELEEAACWERDDRVPGRPAMTAFRRRARLQQARWRAASGHPVGTQPIDPRPGASGVREVGSRLPMAYARETGANFLTADARAAIRRRASFVEPHQSVDHQRLWADLLSSPALAVNLFGQLAADVEAADAFVHAWFDDVPGRVTEVRFVHSPGRFDPAYLNSLRQFDAAFVLDLGAGANGVLAVNVAYHERAKAETPRPENLDRYRQVAHRSGAFAEGAVETLSARSDLCVMWLEHLLLLSMLQHDSGSWAWGRHVVLGPSGNVDLTELTDRYRSLLRDESTFASSRLEDLVRPELLPPATVAAVTDRYLPT